MSSPLVITIAARELFNKILFLWKMSSCGNQNSSQKWISFDWNFLEGRLTKEQQEEKELRSGSSGGGFPEKGQFRGEVGHHFGIGVTLSEVPVYPWKGILITAIWSLSHNFVLSTSSYALIFGLTWIDPSPFSVPPPPLSCKSPVSTLLPFCTLANSYLLKI